MRLGEISKHFDGYYGKYHPVDCATVTCLDKECLWTKYLILWEHDTYGDETAFLITDASFNILCDDWFDGIEQYLKDCPECLIPENSGFDIETLQFVIHSEDIMEVWLDV